MNRRTVLGGIGAASTTYLAGCVDRVQPGDDPRYPMEVTVQNDHDRSYDVQVVVTDEDDAAVFEQSFALAPGEGRGIGDDVPAGEYTVTVTLSDRSELRSFWNTDQCTRHRVRTEIAADGHVTHHAACLSEEGEPPWNAAEPP